MLKTDQCVSRGREPWRRRLRWLLARHGEREGLLGFYRKTVEASPRDARWSIVLARLETALEDYPAADRCV